MESFKTLTEGKISMARVKAGDKVNVIHSGRFAKQVGVSGQNVYGGKVQVMGLGAVIMGQDARKAKIFGKDVKDLKNKFKDEWNKEEIRYGQYWSANGRLDAFMREIAKSKGMKKATYTVWVFKVLDGDNKGAMSYAYIDMMGDEKWEVRFLNKSTEFYLEA